MSHFRVNRNPSLRDLRWFGLLLPVFVALVGAIARWQFEVPAAALGIWSAGGALAALYWLVPPLRRHILVRLDVCRPAHWLDHLALGYGRRLLRRRDANRPAVASRPRRHAAPPARPQRAQLLDRAPPPQRLAPLLTAVLIREQLQHLETQVGLLTTQYDIIAADYKALANVLARV